MSKTPELLDDEDLSSARDEELQSIELIAPPSRFPNIIRLAIALCSLFLLLVGSAWVLPRVAPTSWTAGPVQALIRDIVGLEVEIRGVHSVTLLPNIYIKAEDVVHRTPGGVSEDFVVSEIELGLSALSLITGRVAVTRLSMVEPAWTLAIGDVQPTDAEGNVVHSSWGRWRDMSVEDFSVEAGSVTLGHDARGVPFQIANINASLAPATTGEGIALRGTGRLRGQEIRLELDGADPRLLVAGNRWPVRAEFSTAVMQVEVDGALAVRDQVQGDFTLRFIGNDDAAVRSLLGLTPGVGAAAAFTISSDVDVSGDSIRFANVGFRSPRNDLQGEFTLRGLSTGEPSLEGSSDIRRTVIDGADLFFLLNSASSLPITNIDVNWQQATLVGTPLGVGEMTVTRTSPSESIVFSIVDTPALGGVLRGTASIDRAEGMLALHLEGKALEVSAETLMPTSDLLAEPPLRGRMTIDFDLITIGEDQDQLMAAVNGSAEVFLTDGLINIPELNDIAGLETDAETGTFRSLNALLRLSHGVARSDDLLLRTDAVNLLGRGELDLVDGAVRLEIGRLGDTAAGRSVETYLLSGAPGRFQLETLN